MLSICISSFKIFGFVLLFLKNRISYFIEWQERSWFSRTFGSDKQKNIFTIRINEADVERAADLIRGIESVKIKNTSED